MKSFIRNMFVKYLRELDKNNLKVIAYLYDNETGKGVVIVKEK